MKIGNDRNSYNATIRRAMTKWIPALNVACLVDLEIFAVDWLIAVGQLKGVGQKRPTTAKMGNRIVIME